MSSVNTAIQLITREQAAGSAQGTAPAASTCSPALARGPWDYDLAEAFAGTPDIVAKKAEAPAAKPARKK